MTLVVIQARMSSKRLPGKVLKFLDKRPILGHVADRCSLSVGKEKILIATSNAADDIPIVEFAKSQGFAYHCGPLEDVYSRLVGAISTNNVDHFVRVCADSPFLDSTLIDAALRYSHAFDVDLVTNVFPRTYPKGQSVEVIRKSAFLDPDYKTLNGFCEEHVTQGFYQHCDKYDILNFTRPEIHEKDSLSWAVDTADEFNAMIDWLHNHPGGPSPFGVGETMLHARKGRNA